jgi:trehalose synthase
MRDAPVDPLARDALREALGEDRHDRFVEAMERADRTLGERVVWHVNSTSEGGGVAELLRPLIGAARGFGMDWRWVTIEAGEDFFTITKRIHDHLHGSEGDGEPLGDDEGRVYDATLAAEAPDLVERVGASDVVVLHDPQAAGLAPLLRDVVGTLIWRCHIGADEPNDLAIAARRFLQPSLERVDARVFSTPRHVWEDIGAGPAVVIAPSIDPTTPKNQAMPEGVVSAILAAAGISSEETALPPTFRRIDGHEGTVAGTARLIPSEPVPDGVPLVVQVSRWDRLKDPLGVLRGFVDHLAPSSDAHLVLAGPALDGIADDPTEGEVLAEVLDARETSPPSVRDRVHLTLLPMEDPQENGAIVNALQRRADIVVQKSLAEGFGLTVAEAMWKGKPVLASAVGGIVDQIDDDGTNGVLLEDPADLETFGKLLRSLLEDGDERADMGRRGHESILERFLLSRELTEHADLLGSITA